MVELMAGQVVQAAQETERNMPQHTCLLKIKHSKSRCFAAQLPHQFESLL
jgi:hypothetical protein